jgi:uncharacterized protein YecA (UPF0149 family)
MGALADGFVAYAQPLIDQTDGSRDQMEKAFAISQVCFNLALLPENDRDKAINEMQASFEMDVEEFAEFRRSIIVPMIRRHEEMFPLMHRRKSTSPSHDDPVLPRLAEPVARREAYPGTSRYSPCPCNSGKKYKFCCGQKKTADGRP